MFGHFKTYTLDRPGPSLMLQHYIDGGYDSGLAASCGYLRLYWLGDLTRLQKQMNKWKATDGTSLKRVRAMDSDYIIDPSIPPRRAWDLCSNRVLPWWIFQVWTPDDPNWHEMLRADAMWHSWVKPSDRRDLGTSINRHIWPAPIPSDIPLDRVRVELLNLGRQVVWLDILALGNMRLIGNIQNHQSRGMHIPTDIVSYLSGLCRAFRIDDLDDE